MGVFSFMNKMKSHARVENKYERIINKGFSKNNNVDKKYTTEFGEYYAKDGSIRIDGFMNEATNYLTSNIYELEHKNAIEKYRYMSTLPEVDEAIDEIIGESIITNEVDDEIIKIAFKDDMLSDELKGVIMDEFEFIRDILLDFKNNGQKLFRQWYIDGCLYIEKVFDPLNVRDGILKTNTLDAMYVTYYTVIDESPLSSNVGVDNPTDLYGKEEVVDEFFIVKKPDLSSNYYNNNNMMFNVPKSNGLGDIMQTKKVPVELITYVDSGIYHPQKYYPYSYLHKALKVSNQLTLLEDALLIYRITRAPERRIFYIEVGNMQPNMAEDYIQKLMRQYRQDKVYDVSTGQINEKGKFLAMTEDFWLPRRNGQATTEVSTLQGGQNLSEVEDLTYFANKIWVALKVPYTRRANKENNGVQFNSGKELTIEELKFYRLIIKIRREFSRIFDDLLMTQLIAKRIVNSEEIEEVISKIKYIYITDNFFTQMLKLDIMDQRLNILNNIDNFVGKYFSMEYVWKEVFEMTKEEMDAMVEKINTESDDGMYDEGGDDMGGGPGGMGGGPGGLS